jgi:hypothetical protein
VRLGLVVLAAALLLLLPPAAPARALTDGDYLGFADRIAAGTRLAWDGSYVSREKGATTRTNANMLLLHAVAALRGHAGPARQDERARSLVERMTRAPAFRLRRVKSSATRAVCWSRHVTSGEPDHISLDAQAAEALGWAWVARRELGLSRTAAARIVAAIDGCARHPAWRYPRALRNQFNWNAQLYASAAIVTGRYDLLRRDYRRHLLRFTARRPARGMRVANLGPGLSFRYSPHLPASRPTNFDTPEYANIVASALQHHARALDGGMRPLPARSLELLRGWLSRLLTGAWTHAGYLNWDTGHGRLRWHSGQYWAFAQQGLLAIAAAPELWSRREHGRWAKALFDRGLSLYARWADEAGGALAPQLPFGIFAAHRDQDLYAARMAANAARAVVLGLGRMPAADPPPLYAFDRDTGRLAVTTPRYSTAIVPSSNGAFAYGGIELARLFAAGQRVAANIGGEPPNAFGVVVSDGSGRELLASQRARRYRGRLRLLRSSPRGSFSELAAVGTVRRGGVRITTEHRFRHGSVDERWEVRCRDGCARWSVDVHLPTPGRATIAVVLRDGTRAALLPGAGAIPMSAVARVELGGYSATPMRGSPDALLSALPTTPQRTAPNPGPTLAIRLTAPTARLGLRLMAHPGPSSTS